VYVEVHAAIRSTIEPGAMGIGHAAFRRFALLPHAPTKIPEVERAGGRRGQRKEKRTAMAKEEGG